MAGWRDPRPYRPLTRPYLHSPPDTPSLLQWPFITSDHRTPPPPVTSPGLTWPLIGSALPPVRDINSTDFMGHNEQGSLHVLLPYLLLVFPLLLFFLQGSGLHFMTWAVGPAQAQPSPHCRWFKMEILSLELTWAIIINNAALNAMIWITGIMEFGLSRTCISVNDPRGKPWMDMHKDRLSDRERDRQIARFTIEKQRSPGSLPWCWTSITGLYIAYHTGCIRWMDKAVPIVLHCASTRLL